MHSLLFALSFISAAMAFPFGTASRELLRARLTRIQGYEDRCAVSSEPDTRTIGGHFSCPSIPLHTLEGAGMDPYGLFCTYEGGVECSYDVNSGLALDSPEASAFAPVRHAANLTLRQAVPVGQHLRPAVARCATLPVRARTSSLRSGRGRKSSTTGTTASRRSWSAVRLLS
jgi:hypothetical protein